MTAMRLTMLDSGLKVASHTMPELQTAAVGLFAEVGSRSEPEPLNGIAHLFEHMVFKGAGERSARAISEAIEEVGGDLNAATERDATSFTATVMAEHVPLAVELIADMIQRPHFAEADLEREKDVVSQELAEVRDTPGDMVFEELWSAAFDSQGLGRSILGDEASVGRIAVADLRAWRDTQYCSKGLALVAAGKVDHDALVVLAEQHFAALPAGAAPRHDKAEFLGGSRVSRQSSEQAHLAFGFAGPCDTSPEYYASRLFADVLGGGASSRLFQQLREDRGLAYSVSAGVHALSDIGLFYIYAGTARREAPAAMRLIEDIVAEAAATVTQRELDRVRTQARAGLLMSLETPWGQAHYVARQLAVHGRLVDPAEIVEALLAVTVDQVREAGQRMIAGPSARATIGVPAAKAA